MRKIDSINNQYIKDLYKLHEKKYRDVARKFLIEGENLIKEAYKTNNLEVLLTSDSNYKLDGIDNVLVSDAIIEKLAFTKTPQKYIGVCKYLNSKNTKASKYLLLDGIQDPGNLGTLIRSCLGFNIGKVYLSNDSVDIYNDKFIRASGGAIFHVDMEISDLEEVISDLKGKNIDVYGTSVVNGVALENIAIKEKYAIILGNEGSGVRKKILEMTTKNIYIKTNPLLESLNVAIAGSIILHYFDLKKS